jgi:hypothetical protein
MRALILAAAIIVPSIALAHGPAHWIELNKAYVTKNGGHCCGVIDCVPAPAWEFYEDADGITWHGKKLLHGKPDGKRGGIYWSDEPDPPETGQQWWVCRRHEWRISGEYEPEPLCIFRPQPKS